MKEKGALQDTPFIMYIKNFVFTLYLPILYAEFNLQMQQNSD